MGTFKLADVQPAVYDIAMTTRFRGLDRRQGMLWRGPAGWAEWSPFWDYSGPELIAWWRAAHEAAEQGFPAPVREWVPVNVTIPAVGPAAAAQRAAESGCATAKIKVAEPGQTLAQDLERVAAVAGVVPRVRVDANGGWDVDTAFEACRRLARYDLEYVEQPCAGVEELAELRLKLARAGLAVAVAADESIRRADDPHRVVALRAADVAVLKVQPLGGVRRGLELAAELGLPVVVSSALETSVGLAAGVALAAALPELPFACGLATSTLLADDPGQPLTPVAGRLRVGAVSPDPAGLERVAADPVTTRRWQARWRQVQELAS